VLCSAAVEAQLESAALRWFDVPSSAAIDMSFCLTLLVVPARDRVLGREHARSISITRARPLRVAPGQSDGLGIRDRSCPAEIPHRFVVWAEMTERFVVPPWQADAAVMGPDFPSVFSPSTDSCGPMK
jgi:hypothetical protein